ncbi:MAG: site-specific integrase [Clostridia bacterium]|nr:site-specific integrase [Clostridia bacterium]
MAKKRENGEGTITKLENGSYMGRIFLGYKADGKPNRKSVYGKTKAEVVQKIQQLSLNRVNGVKESSSMALGRWMVFWLENFKKLKLKPKTYEVYDTQARHHIIPSLGEIPLKDLNSLQIQKYINDKSKPLSPATIRKQYNILNSALEKALANDMITKNPCKNVELPILEQKEIKALTLEEENKFIEESRDDRLHTLFVLAFDSGLRLGELLALTWGDVDFEKAEVTVNKNLIHVKDYEGKSNSKNVLKVQDNPKTKSSIRKVPLPQRSLKLLKELKSKTNTIMVFATKTGNYLNPRNAERSFVRIATKIGFDDCNFHSLRHTYATRLFEVGIPVNVVSKLLGHAKTSITTDIYISVMPSLKNDAVKVLDLLHSGKLGNKPIINQLQTN